MDKYSHFKIGFTTLNILEKSPKLFKKYQDDLLNNPDKEVKESYFKLGSAIHCKVFEPKEFNNRYYVSTFTPPTGKYADAVKLLAEINEIDDSHIEAVIKMVDLKGKFDTIKEKLLATQPYIDYLLDLKKSKNKEIISPEESVLIESCVSNLFLHKKAVSLLMDNPFDNGIKTINEKEIIWKYKNFNFDISSTPDRLLIDPLKKIIYVIDLKTTSKGINNFKYSYTNFKYYRQAAIYNEAITYEYLSKPEYEGYKIINYIVAVETTGLNDVKVFSLNNQDLELGKNEFEILLKRLDYHLLNDNWDYNMEYYLGNGVEELSLDEKD